MLNYADLNKDDKRIQKILKDLNDVLANDENIVEKRHETYGDMADGYEYIIWNRGVEVCRISEVTIFFGAREEGVILPNDIAKVMREKLEKRCVKGEQAKSIEYNLLLARLARFKAR